MRYLLIAVLIAFVVSSSVDARPAYKAALGLSACTDCHVKGKFKEPNKTNQMWVKATEMVAKTKAGEGEFKGKSCNDCHKGHSKPEAAKGAK